MENISVKTANKFMLMILMWLTFVSVLLPLVVGNMGITLGPSIIISQILVFLIPFIVYIITKKEEILPLINKVLMLKSLSGKNVAFVLGMMVLIHPTILVISFLSTLFTPNIIGDVVIDITAYGFLIGFLIIAITPSIFEEIIFRGVIFYEYKNVSIHKAAFMNGIFFGIIHMNLHQAISAFVLGFFFIYIIYYTKSFFSVFLAHVYFNGVQFAILYFASSNPELLYAAAAAAEEEVEVMPLLILAGLTLPLFIMLFTKFTRYNSINIENENENENENIEDKPRERIFTIHSIVTIVIFIVFNILIMI